MCVLFYCHLTKIRIYRELIYNGNGNFLINIWNHGCKLHHFFF